MGLAIILIRPQMGENIGAAARACANFGVGDLRLVAPRDGWPNPKAADMAGRALNVIDDARVFKSAREAVADCQFVLATTARSRAVNMPAFDTQQAVAELQPRAARGEKLAIMFGPERTGLENDEVALAHGVLHIPVTAEYSSLNLAQAVVVVLAQWFQTIHTPTQRPSEPPAPQHELHGLFDQLEAALDTVNFWRVPDKKDSMWRNLRAGLMRAQFTAQEVATWRGLLRALTEPRR